MFLTSEIVKLIAGNKFSLAGNWCKIINNEMFLINGSYTIKLLLHRREINKFVGKLVETGISIAPVSIYQKNGKFKIKIALVKGKKQYDKRDAEKKVSVDLENRRIIKSQKLLN